MRPHHRTADVFKIGRLFLILEDVFEPVAIAVDVAPAAITDVNGAHLIVAHVGVLRRLSQTPGCREHQTCQNETCDVR